MKCEELRVDLRKTTQEERAEGQRCAQLLFQLNHTQFGTEEYDRILHELLGDNLGEDSNIAAPLNGACVSSMKLGKNVFINTNLLAMARGGITIEDDVRIAANVQLISTPMTCRCCCASRCISRRPLGSAQEPPSCPACAWDGTRWWVRVPW